MRQSQVYFRAYAFSPDIKISSALRGGKVSFSKVRAMTRVATPQNEDYLLMIANHGTASHVERLVRNYRRVKRAEWQPDCTGARYAFPRERVCADHGYST